MAKWYNIIKGNREYSRNDKRFYTDVDMMEIKRMESVSNSEQKRGLKEKKHSSIYDCRCGCEGCFIIR